MKDKVTPRRVMKMLLWVVGWMLIFPVPLTILVKRNPKMKKSLKIATIVTAWTVFIIWKLGTPGGGNEQSATTRQIPEITEENVVTITELKMEADFVNGNELALREGESSSDGKIIATVQSTKDVTTDDIVLISDDPNIAKAELLGVDGTDFNFVVTGVAKGETDIYAETSDGEVQSDKLHIIVPEEKIAGLDFTEKDEVRIEAGKSVSPGCLKADVRQDETISEEDIQFVSENKDVADIKCTKCEGSELYFEITGVSPGETSVYAKYIIGKDIQSMEPYIIQSEKIHVIVEKPVKKVESITFGEIKDTLMIGESVKVEATVSPDDAEDKTLTWNSSDENVVTVDDGLVKAVGGGSAIITAKASNDIESSFNVNVDASRRIMQVSVSYDRLNDINIGHELSYYAEVDGDPLEDYIPEKEIAVGQTIGILARVTEDDKDPDIGENYVEYTVTEDDIINGFEVSLNVDVEENGGRYIGKIANFIATVKFRTK